MDKFQNAINFVKKFVDFDEQEIRAMINRVNFIRLKKK